MNGFWLLLTLFDRFWTFLEPKTGQNRKLNFGVLWVIPLGIPSNLHGHLPGENLTGKFYILEKFEIFGSGTEKIAKRE